MSGLLCSGDVRVAYVDADGVPTGQHLGILNPVKLALNKPAPDLKQRISGQNDSFGEALDQVEFPKPTEVSFTVDDAGDAETLSWALGGTSAGYTQTSATAATLTLSAVEPGQWAKIGKRRLSNVVVKDSTDSTTYVLNTDYLLDAEAGFIKPTTGGGISSGDDLHITYDAAALTGSAVSVGTRQAIQVQIEGNMKNLATGEYVHVFIPKAKLSPTGELDFRGADFLPVALNGTALVITGQSPATVTLIDNAA